MSSIAAGSRVGPSLSAASLSSTGEIGRMSARFTATTHADLASVREAWAALEAEGACTAYQCFDWAAGIVATLMASGQAKPVVVEIRDAGSGRAVMLLPFALIRRRGHTVLTWLDLDVCDYAAPLVAPGFTPSGDEMAAIWSAVRAVLPRVDLIHIERIPEQLDRAGNPLALLPGVHPMTIQAYRLAIDGPADTLLQRMCPKSAYDKYKKNGRRLAREGNAERFVVADTPADVDTLFDVLIAQRRARFRSLGRFDLLDKPEVRAFYHGQVQAGLTGGPARLFGLKANDAWMAAALAIVHDRTLNILMLSMDPAWGMVAPGLRIGANVMLWARDQGLEIFDLTIGDLPYKAELGAKPHRVLELTVPTSLMGRIVLAGTQARVQAKAQLQSRPELFDRLRRGRQALRRLAKRGSP